MPFGHEEAAMAAFRTKIRTPKVMTFGNSQTSWQAMACNIKAKFNAKVSVLRKFQSGF